MKNAPKAKADRLPQTLFVRRVTESASAYLQTDDDPEGLAVENQDIVAGRYELVEYVKIANRTTVVTG